LSDECPHCVEQLVSITNRASNFGKRNTELLAISGKTPAANAQSIEMAELSFRLLSHVGHENTHRYYSGCSSICVGCRGRRVWRARRGRCRSAPEPLEANRVVARHDDVPGCA